MTRQCGKKALALNQHSSREDTDVSDPQFTSETQKQPERRAGSFRSCSGRAESPDGSGFALAHPAEATHSSHLF